MMINCQNVKQAVDVAVTVEMESEETATTTNKSRSVLQSIVVNRAQLDLIKLQLNSYSTVYLSAHLTDGRTD